VLENEGSVVVMAEELGIRHRDNYLSWMKKDKQYGEVIILFHTNLH